MRRRGQGGGPQWFAATRLAQNRSIRVEANHCGPPP